MCICALEFGICRTFSGLYKSHEIDDSSTLSMIFAFQKHVCSLTFWCPFSSRVLYVFITLLNQFWLHFGVPVVPLLAPFALLVGVRFSIVFWNRLLMIFVLILAPKIDVKSGLLGIWTTFFLTTVPHF